MPTTAVLFDLDDTLVIEEPAAVAAFSATAGVAAARHSRLDARRLAVRARACAREAWYASPLHPYVARLGISSWEGLWCRFEGDAPELRALRAWAPEYRRTAWHAALTEQGIDDRELAAELGERFGVERRARHQQLPGAEAVLDAIGARHPLALITNGASCLQREKLAGAGLAAHFDAVVVSGDVGIGKPDPAAFARALDALAADPRDAVMIGDNLARDIDGAAVLGIRGIWLNRHGAPVPDGHAPVEQIRSLDELPARIG